MAIVATVAMAPMVPQVYLVYTLSETVYIRAMDTAAMAVLATTLTAASALFLERRPR
jgi:hypothetical protein